MTKSFAEEIQIELSVVMPCLNESDTLAVCIEKARRAMDENGIVGEIIVADNGSTDDSPDIARRLGARVIAVQEKGYGSALMGGIAAAKGRFVIMGDADDSYDFLEIPKFVGKLREGYDLVQGCRLPSGGGRVLPGAMPWLHRWWGNPMFSALARLWFYAPINDIYCGLRGFTKTHYDSLQLQCTGMEFATEMIIKSSLYNRKLSEVPITLHPDGRKSHPPHLRTFRDGWRTLRFFLLYSPKWVFYVPGRILILAGIIGYILALPGWTLMGRIHFDVHTLLFSSLLITCGYQAILFAILTKTFAINEKMVPEDKRLTRFYSLVDLEKGILISFLMIFSGLFLLSVVVNEWMAVDFGNLNYPSTLRYAIPGFTLASLGFESFLFSFFASMLGINRR
ncbi:MAG TPA: glycosyltransferase family 2 protein [Pyrinomonadaceae bacterium]|jgi:glycosyltransferase involved in cell wall biosynthesis